ncbi:MAG: prepilin-type N-terminal cleavage/methylation domain-containing protein, partial [Clostridia bacterium]
MKKKFKAFTLIELIVTMLIMGIIMAGIMRMFQPINDV